MKTWATIADALAQHGRCAMVTVAGIQGSAPREAGARMIVMPDGGFCGTIGGGALEWRALADARTLLAEDQPQARLRRQALGPELGQCCGGSVRLLVEVFDRSMSDEIAKLAAREAGGGFATVARLSYALAPAKAGCSHSLPIDVLALDARTHTMAAKPPGLADGCSGQARASQRGKGTGLGKRPAKAGTQQNVVEESGSPLSRGRAEIQSAGALVRRIVDSPDTDRPQVEIAPDGTVFETFTRRSRPLWLFGAGHVGRAMILALAPLPFDVTWIDPRREAFPAATPANVRSVHLTDPAAALAGAPADAFVLVMTHSHALDLELVHAALAAERFAYVGLIGSATKRARFRKRLKDLRLSGEGLSRLVCPIGLAGIASKAPAAIAASVAADLLIRHEAVERRKEAVAPMAERA